MESRPQELSRWRRRVAATLLACSLILGLAAPASANTFTWTSYNSLQNYAGTLIFADGSAHSRQGSDWNEWGFGDYRDGGYTHLIYLYSKVNGAWVLKSHRYIGEGGSVDVNVYLPEGEIRFKVCMYGPDGNQTYVPGCLNIYGNSNG